MPPKKRRQNRTGRSYWMIAESDENFRISRDMGFRLHGLGAKYRKRAQRMQPNDRVLFYVSQLRKWTLTATITSHSFVEHEPIWKSTRRGDNYPYRLRMAPDIVLEEDEYIDARILAPGLEYLKRWIPEDWPLAFFDKLHLLPQRDFSLVEGEMRRIVGKRPRDRSGRAETTEERGDTAADGGQDAKESGQASAGAENGDGASYASGSGAESR